jgi:hypothetical protein
MNLRKTSRRWSGEANSLYTLLGGVRRAFYMGYIPSKRYIDSTVLASVPDSVADSAEIN